MEAVLQHELPAATRARAELAAATMSFAMDDIPASRSWWTAAAEHAAAADDVLALANAVAGVGLALLAGGDSQAAESRFREAVPLAAAAGPAGDWTSALIQIWLGTVALLHGDAERAVDRIERGRAAAANRGDRLTQYVALYNLSQAEVARGRHAVARGHLEDGTRLSMETGDHANLAYFLDALAVLEAADGRHARVPLLVGAAQGLREALGARGYGYYRPDPEALSTAVQQARGHLGADRYDDALDLGRRLQADAAVALALGEQRG
jgi:tetratricopeptide (TPR) repeat protein